MTVTYRYVGEAKSKPALEITDDVALWTARMIVGEGGAKCSRDKAAALCWAIVNRWFLWPGRRRFKSFVSLMRAFSQPINPRWMTGGDLARKYALRDAGSAARLARREKICAMQMRHIPRVIRGAIRDFANGDLLLPDAIAVLPRPRVSNWASLKSTPVKFPHGVDIDGDWFFEDYNLSPGFVMVRIENGD